MCIGIVIQARLSSTRLPRKILLPFYGTKTILDIIIEKLQSLSQKVVIATSVNSENDELEQVAHKCGVPCYRGSENDVLRRFIGAARSNGIDKVVRICSDNPFLDLGSMKELLDAASQNETNRYDYISFSINGTPSIKTHYGFWTEFVTLAALERACAETAESIYHEHVTNYIYAHPESFKLKWLPVSENVRKHNNVRLTIDTEEDFDNAKHIYGDLFSALSGYPAIDDVLDYLDAHSEYYNSMKRQIDKNSK